MILAFDTSGPVGSVAVAAGADVLARGVMTRQAGHAALLVPTIDDVLDDAGVDREEIALIVVGEGPGSFTGVRVAAATAKGLGRALGVPVRAVSSLAAAAFSADAGAIRYAIFDARAERVYAACWGVGSDHCEELIAPTSVELRDLMAGDVPPGAVFVGDAAQKHRALIEAAGHPVVAAERERPHADGLVAFAARVPGAPVDDLGAWEPAYVRASSAERLWKS